jgi:hypothetical protein
MTELPSAPREHAETMSGPRAASRSADLRLARLHLRVGAVALARAELEAAAADAALPPDSLLALAEARWRSDDLAGAGEAAVAAQAAGAADPIAAVIATEAGRSAGSGTGEGQPCERPDIEPDVLDQIFAGLPRGPGWPPDHAALEAVGPLPTEGLATERSSGSLLGGPARAAPGRSGLPEDPASELEAARDELAAGQLSAAAIRLAVVLRARPSAAPAVAELLEQSRDPGLSVVRGDALRLLGRAAEAERAWAMAAAGLPRRASGQPRAEAGASPESPTSAPSSEPSPGQPASEASAPSQEEPT